MKFSTKDNKNINTNISVDIKGLLLFLLITPAVILMMNYLAKVINFSVTNPYTFSNNYLHVTKTENVVEALEYRDIYVYIESDDFLILVDDSEYVHVFDPGYLFLKNHSKLVSTGLYRYFSMNDYLKLNETHILYQDFRGGMIGQDEDGQSHVIGYFDNNNFDFQKERLGVKPLYINKETDDVYYLDLNESRPDLIDYLKSNGYRVDHKSFELTSPKDWNHKDILIFMTLLLTVGMSVVVFKYTLDQYDNDKRYLNLKPMRTIFGRTVFLVLMGSSLFSLALVNFSNKHLEYQGLNSLQVIILCLMFYFVVGSLGYGLFFLSKKGTSSPDKRGEQT